MPSQSQALRIEGTSFEHEPRPVAARSAVLSTLFAGTLFWSAALIFTVEPMFGKLVLPKLGGAPAVWNTCMVFFQATLLGGYAYAHVLTRALTVRWQLFVHAGLLGVAGLTLPVALPGTWLPEGDGSPALWLLVALTAGVGAPLFLLFSTAPLLQLWFSRTRDKAAGDPYFLYAASNAGSLLALLAYPLVIEPRLSLSTQSALWAAGYAVLIALILLSGLSAARGSDAVRVGSWRESTATQDVGWPERAQWLALSLVPSSLMLSVTTYLSTDVAAVPLLWAIPLAIYLLSFVLAFSNARPSSGLRKKAVVAAVLPLVIVLILGINRPMWLIIPIHLAVLFVFSTALHTQLALHRPSAERLTEFYLWIAAGGVCGGLLNTFVAPLVFTTIAEYPLVLTAGAFLLSWGTASRPPAGRLDPGWILPLCTGVLTAVLVLLFRRSELSVGGIHAAGAALLFTYVMSSRHPRVFAATLMLMLVAGYGMSRDPGHVLHAERTFFGVHRVIDLSSTHERRLMHGTTFHGGQLTRAAMREQPAYYYHPAGPIGQVFAALEGPLARQRIGVIGLGAGGLAAYARDGQQWTFYEIDPAVERIARDPSLFTYLERCGADCRVVLGDARLSLERNRGSAYQLLIVDAFSSDAIPVHLITREAFEVYLSHLSHDGVLALQISNRHLDLRPLVSALARDAGLTGRMQHFEPEEGAFAQTPSVWVVASRSQAALGPLASDSRWRVLEDQRPIRLWTDDYSSIPSVWKLRWPLARGE
jgi:hypothetical protein